LLQPLSAQFQNLFILKPENSVLKVLAWFDLFNYPLTLAEIQFFLDQPLTQDELKVQLQELTRAHIIFRPGGFYSLQHDEALAVRRNKGNQRAKEMLAIAHRVARLLYHFPYVRGIGISGSLSKNFADEKSDIDLFIITSSNRLWIARTVMYFLRKLSSLNIEEQNIFTATELITLMPVCGNDVFNRFYKENSWAKNHYSNYVVKFPVYKDTGKGYYIKKFVELLFNNRVGNWLDNHFMKVTKRRWDRKEEENRITNMRGEKIGLHAGKHFFKPKPGYFQKQILERYQEKLNSISMKWNKTQVVDHVQ
jgi:predicted nucleotidyltransferase